jgi:hypothetical protein
MHMYKLHALLSRRINEAVREQWLIFLCMRLGIVLFTLTVKLNKTIEMFVTPTRMRSFTRRFYFVILRYSFTNFGVTMGPSLWQPNVTRSVTMYVFAYTVEKACVSMNDNPQVLFYSVCDRFTHDVIGGEHKEKAAALLARIFRPSQQVSWRIAHVTNIV